MRCSASGISQQLRADFGLPKNRRSGRTTPLTSWLVKFCLEFSRDESGQRLPPLFRSGQKEGAQDELSPNRRGDSQRAGMPLCLESVLQSLKQAFAFRRRKRVNGRTQQGHTAHDREI